MDSGEKCTELVDFSSLVALQNKKRKAAQPQVTRGTSSPGGLCSRATFRQLQYQTYTIVDRSSLTSALISAYPLAASDVGSSDRRTNDLGAVEGAMILCEEQNKKSNVGTISYLPALFGIGCASVVIRDLTEIKTE